MNVDTGTFTAITAERDELRSDVALMVRVVARAADALDAAGLRPAPVLTVVAGTGRHRPRGGRHAAPRPGLRLVQGGRR